MYLYTVWIVIKQQVSTIQKKLIAYKPEKLYRSKNVKNIFFLLKKDFETDVILLNAEGKIIKSELAGEEETTTAIKKRFDNIGSFANHLFETFNDNITDRIFCLIQENPQLMESYLRLVKEHSLDAVNMSPGELIKKNINCQTTVFVMN